VTRRILLIAFSIFAFACSSENDDSGGNAGTGGTGGIPPQCEAMLSSCVAAQKTCALVSGAPSCVACENGHYAGNDGACVPIPGTRWTHQFPDFTSESGEEILDQCRSWTLGNDTDLWVNSVELEQNEASHHSNWTFVPDKEFPGEDGTWTCDDRGYDQLSAALLGGVIYAQSTQATREVQKFADGVVVRIPAHSKIISAVHILNTSSETVTGHVTLSLYALEENQVTTRLAPFHVSYDGLDIPAKSTARFSGECDVSKPFPGGQVAAKIHWMLPHTHALGSRFFLEIMGGPNDGQSVIDIQDFFGEANGTRYDPPIDLTGALGVRFGCEFENPRSESVKWGFGDQEMCEALGFYEAPLAFESRIDEAIADGSEGDILKFTGECSTIALPWENKN
jgi:hypothetical protein